MQDLIVVLGAAALVATLFHLVKVPPIVAFFTAGAVIGPHAFGFIKSPPQVEIMAEGAALLLMFTIGLEFSFKELKSLRRPLIILGFGQVLATILIFSSSLHFLFNFSVEKSLFWSFIITLSSTAVVLKVLADHRDFESPHGKSAFAILLSQDLAVIPMLIAIPFLKAGIAVDATHTFGETLLPLLLLIGVAVALVYFIATYALPLALHHVAQTKNREVFFFFMVFTVAIFAIGAHKAGLSYSMGAFLAGMLISGSVYGRQATADFKPLRDAFLGIFFVIIGMMLDLQFLFENLHRVWAIGTIVLGVKAAIIFLLMWFTGNSGAVARIVSVFIAQMGEFSFILADQGFKLGLIEQNELQYFLAIAIISLATTPFVYRLIPYLSESNRFRKLVPLAIATVAHGVRSKMMGFFHASIDNIHTSHGQHADVLIIGFGVAGRALARVLKSMDISYRVIEANGETVKQYASKEPILFGDAASEDILESAGIMSAKLIVVLTSGVSTLEPVMHSIKKLRSECPIIARTNYLLDLERFKDIGPISMVVSELETTLETIARTLTKLDVEPEIIEEFSVDLRQELEKHDLSVSLR